MVRNVSIKNLAEVTAARMRRPAVFQPQKVGNKWHSPKWSAMAIARERKRVLQRGGVWQWDIPKKEVEKQVMFKGHLRDLRREQRQEEIKRCMARMPKLIEEYRKNSRKKERTGLADILLTPRSTSLESSKKRKKKP